MRYLTILLSCSLVCFTFVMDSVGQEKEPEPKKEKEETRKPLTAIDSAGKEIKLKSWKFVQGTRRLPWASTEKDKKDGPEYLEFREQNSTLYKDGIVTFVPLNSVRKISYNAKDRTLTITVAAKSKDIFIKGPAKFVGINKLIVEAEADLGELGSAAVKHRIGDKKGLRSISFAEPQPLEVPDGEPIKVTGRDNDRTKHSLFSLTPLYMTKSGAVLIPKLMFKKTVKVDFNKITKLKNVLPAKKTQASYDFEVTLPSGQTHTLTLIRDKHPVDDKLAARLLGLFGKSATGYKLFAPHTVVEMVVPTETKKD